MFCRPSQSIIQSIIFFPRETGWSITEHHSNTVRAAETKHHYKASSPFRTPGAGEKDYGRRPPPYLLHILGVV
jgi:hypothetical protein